MAWSPKLAPRGREVFDSYAHTLLVEGARWSGKTIAICNKLIRHAVENDGAIVAIVAKSKKIGDVGVWNDLIGRGGIIDQWIAAGVGLAYTVEPRYKADSKMAFFRIRTPPTPGNQLGGEAEFQLHSINNENEVETMFKSARFSAIYVVEADGFSSRKVLSALRQQLRAIGVHESRYQIILDTNPPEDAEDHWLWKVFFEEKAPGSQVIHFSVDDNPFITAEAKQRLFDEYKYDRSLLDRYYYGKWVKASKDGVFADVFNPKIHVIGEIPADADVTDYEARNRWNILRPDSEATRLDEGFDIGDVNTSYHIGASRYNRFHKTICFDILDELCYLDTRIGINDVVDEVEARRDYWSRYQNDWNGITKVRWQSWSDSSSLRHRIASGSTEAMEIYRLSDKKIVLGGVRKGSGSVARRRDLLKRLLFENRIYISPICTTTIKMLKYIKSKPGFPIDPESPLKHCFDSLTYMLGYALPEESGRNRLEKPKMEPMSVPV